MPEKVRRIGDHSGGVVISDQLSVDRFDDEAVPRFIVNDVVKGRRLAPPAFADGGGNDDLRQGGF